MIKANPLFICIITYNSLVQRYAYKYCIYFIYAWLWSLKKIFFLHWTREPVWCRNWEAVTSNSLLGTKPAGCLGQPFSALRKKPGQTTSELLPRKVQGLVQAVAKSQKKTPPYIKDTKTPWTALLSTMYPVP